MAVFYYKTKIKLVSVNKWTAIRIIKNKYWRMGMPLSKQYIPMVYQTAVYKKMKSSLANAMRGVKLTGYYDLRLHVSLWKQRDTDNVVKAILDALEDSEVISNDRMIRDISIIRAYHKRDEEDILIIELFKPKFRTNSWAGEQELSFLDQNE